MRPQSSFISQPIRALQTMLRVIATNDDQHSSVVPDGIYGPNTVRAVSVFQRLHGIPVTGVTDIYTWEAIHAAYELALVEQNYARGLFITLNPGQVIRKGETAAIVRLVQAMLTTFSEIYAGITAPGNSGTLDAATADSLASFQSLAALPITGELDKHTWKHMALHYPLACDRHTAALREQE